MKREKTRLLREDTISNQRSLLGTSHRMDTPTAILRASDTESCWMDVGAGAGYSRPGGDGGRRHGPWRSIPGQLAAGDDYQDATQSNPNTLFSVGFFGGGGDLLDPLPLDAAGSTIELHLLSTAAHRVPVSIWA